MIITGGRITEEEGLTGFPRGSRHNILANQKRGAAGLGWYRGIYAGIWDSYLFLRKEYPEAAEALLDKFGIERK